MKTIGLPKGAKWSSFCWLGRFGASNLDRPAISRRFRQRPQEDLVQLSVDINVLLDFTTCNFLTWVVTADPKSGTRIPSQDE